MKRYAVKITDSAGRVSFTAIGLGTTEYPQNAHLYAGRDLAEKKLEHYNTNPQWYKKAEIAEVEVTGLS